MWNLSYFLSLRLNINTVPRSAESGAEYGMEGGQDRRCAGLHRRRITLAKGDVDEPRHAGVGAPETFTLQACQPKIAAM